VLRDLALAEIAQAADALRSARCIYVCGNGGSMATAIHFACDLQKQARLRAFSLDNISKITAYGNDTDYGFIFSAQLGHIGHGDVLVAISGSGESINVLNAARMARGHDAQVIGLTVEGGLLSVLSDIAIRVPSKDMEQIEDVHLMVCHMITRILTC